MKILLIFFKKMSETFIGVLILVHPNMHLQPQHRNTQDLHFYNFYNAFQNIDFYKYIARETYNLYL